MSENCTAQGLTSTPNRLVNPVSILWSDIWDSTTRPLVSTSPPHKSHFSWLPHAHPLAQPGKLFATTLTSGVQFSILLHLKKYFLFFKRIPRTRENAPVRFLCFNIIHLHGYWFHCPVKGQWCSKWATYYYNSLRILRIMPLAGAPPHKNWARISKTWCWAQMF